MSQFQTINFKKWIDDHRELLKPPVGNKMIWKDKQFIIMVVGGPNKRTDYHINQGEEFFYQVEGNITLKVINQGGGFEDVQINEGEIFLLPPLVPHSPQRPEGTVGLVIEKTRLNDEKDGLAWFCQKCKSKLYDEYFHLKDIETDLPPVFDRFYADKEKRHCEQCGADHDDKGRLIS